MNNLKNIFKLQKKYLILSVVVLLGLIYFLFGNTNTKREVYVVKRANVSQSVVLSGNVQTTDRADLGFASSGRVGNIFVKNNQLVKKGDVLAQLEIEDLLADLKIKQANLRTSDVDLEAAKDELDRVTKQEETKVQNAYRELLSSGLTLIPESNDYTVTAPTVSGLYDSIVGGQYKISIDKENITLEDVKLKTFGLEKTARVVDENAPTPLGTHGLYVSFPVADVSLYKNTTWYLDVPNKSSSEYVTNYNAYMSTIRARDLAVQEAQFKYKKILSEGTSGETTIAQAEIQKINAEIKKNTIYAPFEGNVTNIEKEVGESASTGERVVSILGKDKLEVVLQVSELDVSRIAGNSSVQLSFDAFPGENFSGTLSTINSKETKVEGVPVYEAFVELQADPRIKTGMSANASIILSSKDNVLVVPSYLITKSGDINTVEVLNTDDKIETRTITLGLVGTDNMVEIVSGLNEGDQVLAKTN